MGGLAGGSGCQLQVNDDSEERYQPFGAQSEAKLRSEAEQRDDQGNQCDAHFAIRDTLTLVQR